MRYFENCFVDFQWGNNENASYLTSNGFKIGKQYRALNHQIVCLEEGILSLNEDTKLNALLELEKNLSISAVQIRSNYNMSHTIITKLFLKLTNYIITKFSRHMS